MKKSFVLLLALLVAAPACFAADPAPDPNPDPGLVDDLIEKIFVTDKVKERAGEWFVKNAAKGNLKAMDAGYKQARSSTHWPEYSTKALLAAAKAGHMKAVQYLLDKGVNVNSYMKPKNKKSDVHYTALCAAFLGHAKKDDKMIMAQFLLDRGANPQVKCNRDESVLKIASESPVYREYRKWFVLKKMLLGSRRVDPDAVSSLIKYAGIDYGNLDLIDDYGNLDLIDELGKKGTFRKNGGRYLVDAFYSSSMEVIERMSKWGADAKNLSPKERWNALHNAIKAGSAAKVTWLLDRVSYTQEELDKGISAVIAVEDINENLVARLLLRGASIKTLSADECQKLLRKTLSSGNTDLETQLLKAVPYSKGELNDIVAKAVMSGNFDVEAVNLLLKHGADFGQHMAAFKKGVPLEKLKKIHAKPTAISSGDLMWCRENGHGDAFNWFGLFFMQKSDFSEYSDGSYLVKRSIERSNSLIISWLVSNGLPVTHKHLEMAVARGDWDIFGAFLKGYKGKVDYTRLLGTAVRNGQLDMAQAFLQKGGDINAYISGPIYYFWVQDPGYPDRGILKETKEEGGRIPNLFYSVDDEENARVAAFLRSRGAR